MVSDYWDDTENEDWEEDEEDESPGDEEDCSDEADVSENDSMSRDESYIDEHGNLWRSRDQYFDLLRDIEAHMRPPAPPVGSEKWYEWKEEHNSSQIDIARAMELRRKATRGEHITDSEKAWYFQVSGGKFPEPFDGEGDLEEDSDLDNDCV